MISRDSNQLLNDAVIAMAHSYLQYVAEAWPWVRSEAQTAEQQVRVLAARQRQDVSEIAELLTDREQAIDFGTFPTQYTDQQFLSLSKVMEELTRSHRRVVDTVERVERDVRSAGDSAAADLLKTVHAHEQDIAKALTELATELQTVSN